ncbi:unnamed protein product [Trichobilharzia regenti]|nr:unnamed protein product [Trichobilharzia regenti]
MVSPLFSQFHRKILILLVPLLFLSSRVLGIHSETVVGCGEAQSNSRLDFGKLKISLFSETTSTLKDVTDVLPNGAYSVPLYDEGVYRIKLTTPKGWYIEPSDGYLLDLHKDPKACSKDFDFSVVGFSIFGQVTTSGMQTGPPGLSVRISELTSHKPIAQNSTQSQGYFMISPVSPGSYSLTVSNQDQTEKDHTRASIVVNVLSDSVTLSEPIVLLVSFPNEYFLGTFINYSTHCRLVDQIMRRSFFVSPSMLLLNLING